jgi:tRNA-dihydrouridine synthase A
VFAQMNRLISVAPMMDCTDRHDRYFLRLISPHVLLYTEMVTTGALIYGDFKRFLQFHTLEHPLALQLGGSDPDELAFCAQLGEQFGYDEINLNVGCPSSRVQSGRFGACLMKDPQLVADCIHAMTNKVKIPVTVKCRIGVDEQDSYELLHQFISLIANAGCHVFIIHARKAWLQGLSPKQNRDIPPLRYDVVKRVKEDFPHLTIILNGGIKTIDEINDHLSYADGIMIGREAYANPYLLADIEARYFSTKTFSREEIITQFIPYVEFQLQNNIKLSHMTRHILGLFQKQKGGKAWRRYLSENAYKSGAGAGVILKALECLIYPS